MTQVRVTVVGLDPKSTEAVSIDLRLRWPTLEARRLNNARHMRELRSVDADVVVVNARAVGGTQAVREIRKSCDGAIIVMVPDANEAELVQMLDAGADDYLDVSAGARQLVARVSAALRRVEKPKEGPEPALECGELEVSPASHEVWVKGRVIHLTPTEFKLLCQLAKNKGRLVTRETLQAAVWGPEGKFYEDSLRKYVQRLRHKIEASPSGRFRIETVPGTGYRLRETPRASSRSP